MGISAKRVYEQWEDFKVTHLQLEMNQWEKNSLEAAFHLPVRHQRVEVDQLSCPEIRIRDQDLERTEKVLELQIFDVAKSFGQNGDFENFRREGPDDHVPLGGVGEGFESQLTLKLSESRVN